MHKHMIGNEKQIEGTLYSVDLLFELSGRKQKDWPFKGIAIEADGPYHYYSPIKKNGALKLSAIAHMKHRIIRAMGYKLFILPFGWTWANDKANLMENVAGLDKSNRTKRITLKDDEIMPGQCDIDELANQIHKEYE